MRTPIVAALVAIGAGAPVAPAQIPLTSDRAAKAMPATYSDPLCELKGSHWKTTAAITHLRSALETADTAKRTRELDKGRDILLEAIENNKQARSSIAWFTLARIYLYQGDVVGADYLALSDGPRLVHVAKALVAIEPMSADALTLLGAGYRRTKQSDEALKTAERLFGLGVDVAVNSFTVTADTATLTGVATGRAAQTARGKPLPPAATGLVFEFIDTRGNVIATEEVQIPALKVAEAFALSVQVRVKGIVGWRYGRK